MSAPPIVGKASSLRLGWLASWSSRVCRLLVSVVGLSGLALVAWRVGAWPCGVLLYGFRSVFS
jgi:hypothetical protein